MLNRLDRGSRGPNLATPVIDVANSCSSALALSLLVVRLVFHSLASEKELQWVIRISVLLVGLAGTSLAFNKSSIISLMILANDILYCIMTPQLACVVHLRFANCYGAISGYAIGLLLRVLSGEPTLGIPPVLLYPGWREEDGVVTQYFPFRTLIVLISLAAIILMSWLFQLGFSHQLIPQSWDVLNAFKTKMEAIEEEGTQIPISNDENNYVFNTAL
ncbi:high affinity choline transporter 1-like [Festucalex cinctus]